MPDPHRAIGLWELSLCTAIPLTLLLVLGCRYHQQPAHQLRLRALGQ